MPSESKILFDAAGLIEKNIKEEFRKQGHHLTGAWEDSITSTAIAPNEIEGLARSYGVIVNEGIVPGNIPYGGVKATGGTSAYIQGLIRFCQLRNPGLTEREAISWAFAIAKVHKREGLSTINSRQYSATGQRQQFIQIVESAIGPEVDNLILTGLNNIIIEEANEPLTQTI